MRFEKHKIGDEITYNGIVYNVYNCGELRKNRNRFFLESKIKMR